MPPYRPQHRTQLWRESTGDFDCGPRTWQHAIDFARQSHRVPGIDRLREMADREGARTTNVYDAARVMDRLGIRYGRKVNVDWDVAVDALRAGKGLHLCIAYGVLTDLQYGKSGDKAFRGGHSIWVQELARSRDGRRLVLSFDSLYDGRRRGIPDGPQWVRLDTMRRAAAAFAGHSGRFWGGIVPPGDTGGGGDMPDDDELELPADPDAAAQEGTPIPPEIEPEDRDSDDDDLDVVSEDEEDPSEGI